MDGRVWVRRPCRRVEVIIVKTGKREELGISARFSVPCSRELSVGQEMRNTWGAGWGWKKDDYFGLEYAGFEVFVEHSGKGLNT